MVHFEKLIKYYTSFITFLSFMECIFACIEFIVVIPNNNRFDNNCFQIQTWVLLAFLFDTISSPCLGICAPYLRDLCKPDSRRSMTQSSIRKYKIVVIVSHLSYALKVLTGIWAGFILANPDQCPGFNGSVPLYPISAWYFALIHFIRLFVYVAMTTTFLTIYSIYRSGKTTDEQTV